MKHSHPHRNEQFAQTLYSEATKIDPWAGTWPPDDTGSSGLAVAKVLVNQGLIGSYKHAFSSDEALDALVQQAVIFGLPWFDQMFDPDGEGFVWPMGSLAGGHEVCLDEINVEDQYVEGPNSWGRGWGLGGRFRMSWDVFDQLRADDGDVTIFQV